jgi:spermidine synthase
VEASTEPFDMRLQRMLAHIPALIHNHPRSILVVGFGAGVTAGTFVVHPEVESIVICEIEKLIPPAASRYFAEANHDVLHDRRTKVVYDDGRHYILTTPDKFDIITADPIHPWVKGTAALYSKEYFELVKRHLNPGGVIAQWVPLYESDPDTVKTELATFFEVFPGGTIWSNDNNGEGYDTVLLGQVEPTKIDVDRMQQRLDNEASVMKSLREVSFTSAVELLATYGGRASDLRPWLEHAHVNRDLDLRLQYLAGMGLNFNNAPVIGSQIRTYRRFPSDLFVGSPQRLQALKTALRL